MNPAVLHAQLATMTPRTRTLLLAFAVLMGAMTGCLGSDA